MIPPHFEMCEEEKQIQNESLTYKIRFEGWKW
jgi:hypothetical protein